MSVAREGELISVKDAEGLSRIMDDFLKEKFPSEKARRITNIARKNFREKLTAVFLSMGLWLMFAYGVGIVQREFTVPVEYSNLPEGLTVERAWPRELTVTLSGDERAFKILNKDALKITLDLKAAKEGRQKFEPGEDGVLGLPRNILLDSVNPPQIEVMVKRNK